MYDQQINGSCEQVYNWYLYIHTNYIDFKYPSDMF